LNTLYLYLSNSSIITTVIHRITTNNRMVTIADIDHMLIRSAPEDTFKVVKSRYTRLMQCCGGSAEIAVAMRKANKEERRNADEKLRIMFNGMDCADVKRTRTYSM
jgi:hypothetical protein